CADRTASARPHRRPRSPHAVAFPALHAIAPGFQASDTASAPSCALMAFLPLFSPAYRDCPVVTTASVQTGPKAGAKRISPVGAGLLKGRDSTYSAGTPGM